MSFNLYDYNQQMYNNAEYFDYYNDLSMGMQRAHFHKIGDIEEDMEIIDILTGKGISMTYLCRCTKCGRTKKIAPYHFVHHSGTSHMHCSKQVKPLVDRKFYDTWKGLKQRIYNPKYEFYSHYGGRGLTCDYDCFADFFDDMWIPYQEALAKYGHDISIDRIDNDLGYVRGNLRWATRSMQQENTSKIRRCMAVSPDNTVYSFGNMQRFVERFPDANLTSKGIQAVCSGRYRYTSNGWIFCYMDDLSRYTYQVDKNGNPIPPATNVESNPQ